MNKKRIERVANAIERAAKAKRKPRLGFNMNYYRYNSEDLDLVVLDKSGHGCGTVACIAGWTCVVAKIPKPTIPAYDFRSAQEWLELSDQQAIKLFTPETHLLYSITPEQAVVTLRRLAATGEVKWENDHASAR